MSYTVYTVRALILRHFDDGEAGRAYALLTDEYGHIIANAKGIRREGSKLRALLATWSVAHISMVRGKSGWRIVSASEDRNIYRDAERRIAIASGAAQEEQLFSRYVALFAAMTVFSRRLIADNLSVGADDTDKEGKGQSGRGHFLSSFLRAVDIALCVPDHTEDNKEKGKERDGSKHVEYLDALQLLYCAHVAHELGYLNKKPFADLSLNDSSLWSPEHLHLVLKQKAHLRKSVEHALNVSHL